jgi:hypothetical protein
VETSASSSSNRWSGEKKAERNGKDITEKKNLIEDITAQENPQQ